jgi:hypothetical protein
MPYQAQTIPAKANAAVEQLQIYSGQGHPLNSHHDFGGTMILFPY